MHTSMRKTLTLTQVPAKPCHASMQAALDCAALRSCRGDAVGAGRTMAIVAMAARILPACSAPHLTAWQT